MKIKSSKPFQSHLNLRRAGAAAVLMCAILQPALAAEPAKGEAVLNFVGADIESVVKAVGHYTSMTFLIDPRVKGTISLISERPVSKAEAFSLLSSALRLQGYSVVIGDGFAKVVPEADAKLQAGPIQAGGRARAQGDQIATQIFRLNYESAPNLVTVLRPLISPNNTINANPGTNSLVITDYADNLKRLGKIIAALDSPAAGDMDVILIRHAIAGDIATMVNRLLEPAPGTGVGDRTSLLADSRTNSVVVRAPSAARANLAKSLIAKLDQPTANPGNVHVVYLKNAEATKLAQTLRAVVSSDTSAPGQAQQGSTLSQSQNQGQAQSAGGMQAGTAPLGGGAGAAQGNQAAGGAAGFIQADASTNTLIITASDAVYRNLRVVIDMLDSRRAQVYIESLIVEVSAERAAEFGVQWGGLTGDSGSRYRIGSITGFASGGNNLISQAAALSAPGGLPVAPGNGLNLGIFRQINGVLGLGAIARALETDGNANILSMPNLITLDNEEARIIVGQNVPFITGQFTTPGAGGATTNPFQTIERKDVGLSLRVRPQVSEGGTVKMAIYQETSSVQPRGVGASDITTNKRSIETNVLVDDGEIIVLGGLIEDTASDNEEKVPGLGDIPVLGNLFKYQTRGRKKTNLMVFLRPTVIRSGAHNSSVAADRYDYIRNAQINSQPGPRMMLPDMPVSILPALENGRFTGGELLQDSAQQIIRQPSLQVAPTPLSPPATTR